ncbi:MAG TPA: Type 1 glutamine amidotransferase-like domain-containing protein [Candidatus Paceibacterota bacterium]|nr:Type 1 glutamine amidotransferase-like domain-containing protein [Candidatus Paceibacterota bacterium]HPT18344.1 Type 1 glutamine amidotransferase-like domain-containing protein [Candidatus Paceibacterota bacterium]
MTKYVLHGGFDKNKGYIEDEFFQEALKNTEENVKILLVFFAESEEYLELRIKQCKEQFDKNKGSKNIEFKIASEENFLENCDWADVIFLSGGRTVKIIDKLKQFQNLKKVFEGKTIVGDSAGVNVLAQLFYSRKSKEIRKGLGILPLKIIVHYTEDIGNPLAEIEPNFETIFCMNMKLSLAIINYY